MYDLEDSDSNLKQQEQALTVLSFIETLESLRDNLGAFINSLPKEHQSEGEAYHNTLKTLCEVLGDNSAEISEEINNAEKLITKFPNKIKRLGIASDLIKASTEKGLNLEEISKRFGLNTATVKRFFDVYNKAAPTVRAKMLKSDVYDVERNMQSIHAMLLRQLNRFETDGEVSARFISEYRQLLAMAERQLKEANSQRKIEQVAALIQEIMVRHCPEEARKEIIKEFQALGMKGFITDVAPKRILADA